MQESDLLFLYCISDTDLTGKIDMPGIDEKNKVFTVMKDGLCAYVSKVGLEEYGENIDANLEDINWITNKAQTFMNIVQELSTQISVIPMKFCTIFKADDRITDMLEANHEGWIHILEEICGKQEWSLKIYCHTPSFLASQMEKEREEIEKKLSGKSKGAAFFLRKKMEDSLNEKCNEIIMNTSNSIFEEIKANVCDYKINKLLAKEITGREEQMTINAALLIEAQGIEEFIRNMEIIKLQYQPQYFIIDYSGPWPLYNFIMN